MAWFLDKYTSQLLLLSPPMNIFEASGIFPSYTKTAEDFHRLSGHTGETVSLSLEHGERILSCEAQGTEIALDEQWLDTPSSYSQEKLMQEASENSGVGGSVGLY